MNKNFFTPMLWAAFLFFMNVSAAMAQGVAQSAHQIEKKEASTFMALMNIFQSQDGSLFRYVDSKMNAAGDSCIIHIKKMGYPLNDLLDIQKTLPYHEGHLVLGDLMKRACQIEYNDQGQAVRFIFNDAHQNDVVECVEITYDAQGRTTRVVSLYENVAKKKRGIIWDKVITYNGEHDGTIEQVAYDRGNAVKMKQKEFGRSKLDFGKESDANAYWFKLYSKVFNESRTNGRYLYDNEDRLILQKDSTFSGAYWSTTETKYTYHGTTLLSQDRIQYNEKGFLLHKLTTSAKIDPATGKVVELGKDEIRGRDFNEAGDCISEYKSSTYRVKNSGIWSDWMYYRM